MGADIGFSLLLACALSFVIALIEVSSNTKVRRPHLTIAFASYLVILVTGNAVATVLAFGFVAGSLPADPSGEVGPILHAVRQAPVLFYAFLGVFAFEFLIQHMNLTLFDKRLLTLNTWIVKARDEAVEASVRAEADRLLRRAHSVGRKLNQNAGLTDEQLNAYVLNWLGAGIAKKLEAAAARDGADPRLVKCLALTSSEFDRAAELARN